MMFLRMLDDYHTVLFPYSEPRLGTNINNLPPFQVLRKVWSWGGIRSMSMPNDHWWDTLRCRGSGTSIHVVVCPVAMSWRCQLYPGGTTVAVTPIHNYLLPSPCFLPKPHFPFPKKKKHSVCRRSPHCVPFPLSQHESGQDLRQHKPW
ncbi:hypothetical protein BYT27DRAFT_6751814 [Phlegmacium glaucopus]|nr:hypothetical protein BYT27DRAFT_6751814 [Phlegmacium glaucopus]